MISPIWIICELALWNTVNLEFVLANNKIVFATSSIGEKSTSISIELTGNLCNTEYPFKSLINPFVIELAWNSPSLFLPIRLPTLIILASKPLSISSKIAFSAINLELTYLLEISCPKYSIFSFILNVGSNLLSIFSPATDNVEIWINLAFLALATLIKFLTPPTLILSILSSEAKCLTRAAELMIVSIL